MPPNTEDQKLARLANRLVFALLAGCLAVPLAGVPVLLGLESLVPLFFFSAIALIVGSGLLLCFVFFARAGFGLAELIFLVLTGATVISILLRLSYRSAKPEWPAVIGLNITVFPILLLGAGWALSVAKRLKIVALAPRLGLMLLGWLNVSTPLTILAGLALASLGSIGFVEMLAWLVFCHVIYKVAARIEERAKAAP